MPASNNESGANPIPNAVEQVRREQGGIDLKWGVTQALGEKPVNYLLITGGKGKPRALIQNDPRVVDHWLEVHPDDRARIQYLFEFFTDLNTDRLTRKVGSSKGTP